MSRFEKMIKRLKIFWPTVWPSADFRRTNAATSCWRSSWQSWARAGRASVARCCSGPGCTRRGPGRLSKRSQSCVACLLWKWTISYQQRFNFYHSKAGRDLNHSIGKNTISLSGNILGYLHWLLPMSPFVNFLSATR